MSVKIDLNWKYNDINTVIIENELLKVVVLPDLGAKIWQLTYKPKYKELLWQNPRIKPQRVPFHSVYDDQFFGGWDELYPNDLEEVINGERYPDHGEIWALPWQYTFERICHSEAVLHLWVETPISNSRVDKWITLREGEAKLRFTHKITNQGTKTQPFLWKLHAALRVDEHSRIDIPAKTVYLEDFGPTRTGRTSCHYNWPFAKDKKGTCYDMRKVPDASSGIAEFQYAKDMKDGWCAITHTKDQIGFGMSYSIDTLPSCWLFASYGGWRNLNMVILEPCTGYPVSVLQGVNQHTHKTLLPGQVLECEVVATIYEGLTSVNHIDNKGNVIGC